MQVLERMGTAGAAELLRALAKESEDGPVRRQAEAAVRRLDKTGRK